MVLHQYNNDEVEAIYSFKFKFQYGFTSMHYDCDYHFRRLYLNSNMVLHQSLRNCWLLPHSSDLNSNMVLHQFL